MQTERIYERSSPVNFALGFFLITSFAVTSYANSTANPKAQVPQTPAVLVKKQTFDAISDALEKKYMHASGGPLKVLRFWDTRRWAPAAGVGSNGEREIYVQGGALLLPIMNSGTFAFTLCHEIGHHLGGEPLKKDHPMVSSAESQADFFATSQCLPQVLRFIDVKDLKVTKENREFANQFCKTEAPFAAAESICEKLVLVSLNTTRTFSSDANPFTPSQDIAPVTLEKYPSDQCRLDTFLAGIKKFFNGDNREYRPKCWFAGTNE